MSQETAISEIVLDDDVRDGVEYKLNVVSVRCYSELCVDVLRVSTMIQPLKLVLDVRTCLIICITTCNENNYQHQYHLMFNIRS